MNKLLKTILAVAVLCAPVFAQHTYVTDINYGNGNVVKETSGNGAPADVCTGLSRYTQKDASAGQNIWQCVNGHMKQQGSVSVTYGTTAGTAAQGNDSRIVGAVQQLTQPVAPMAEWAFDAGTGTTVADITGNGHDGTFCASTGAPSWGLDGVHFLNSALTPYQCISTNVQSWHSISIAYEVYTGPATTGTSGAFPSAYNTTPTVFGTTNTTGVSLASSPTVAVGVQNSGAVVPTLYLNTDASRISSVSNGFGQRHIVTVIANSGTPDTYYVDGVLQPLSVSGSSLALIPTTGAYQFGAGNFGNNTGFRGTILYATLFSSALTATQVEQETQYIDAKIERRPLTLWTTASTRSPTVVFAGDSLWAGRAGTGVWTSVLTLNGTYNVINRGVSGLNAFDVGLLAQSTWLQDVSPYSKTYVVFDGGSNDLAGSSTAENIWASYVGFAAKARAAGAIPIASTIISRGSVDASIPAVNAIIRARWKQAGFAALLDNYERPEFSLGAYSNTTFYNADATHLTGGTTCSTATGYGLFCVGASKVINTLDGSSQSSPDTSNSNAYVETDANNFIIQTPTASATHQLVDCSWITGLTKTVVNNSTFTITMATTASQTIVGKSTVAAGTSATFTSVPLTPSGGGCYWIGQ